MKKITLSYLFLLLALAGFAQSINVSVSNLDFEDAFPGYYTRIQKYTLSASGLSGDLTVMAPQGYEVSTDCASGFSGSLVLSPSGGSLNRTVYARFYPASSGVFSGNITHNSAGATTQNISVNETTGTSNIPSGYYSTATSTGAALKTELYNIIKNHTVRSYGALWTDYQSTDVKPNGKVWDMYTDNGGCQNNSVEFTFISDQCGNYGGEGDCYNREHSFPKSWFNDASPMNTDLYHVVPSDGYSNGMRSNYPYGEVSSASYTTSNGSKRGNNNVGSSYSGLVFEPADIYKGDFARIYFYMATRYETQINSWDNNSSYADAIMDGTSFPCYEQWFLDMLVQWHLQDPVSQKEIERNDNVYSIQNNRNPYVDNPAFVMQVWGGQISTKPEPDAFPSNFVASALSMSEVRVDWQDAQGSVIPDGYLLKANLSGNFSDPQDGVEGNIDNNLSDGDALVRVQAAVETYSFAGLDTATIYHFRIWPYTNSGSSINYKLASSVPGDTALTKPDDSGIFNKNHQLFFDTPFVSNDQLIVNLKSNQQFVMTFYDISGRKLQKKSISGFGRKVISLENLPKGLFILNISSDNQSFVFKIMY